MKVLHLNAYFGTSALYSELYSALSKRGLHQQDVIAPKGPCDQLNAPVHTGFACHQARLFRLYHRLLFPLKARCYTRYCESTHSHLLSQADVLHAHTLFTDGTPAYRLSRAHRKPLIVAVRCTDLDVFYRLLPWWRPYAWRTLMAATYVITLSDTYRKRLLGQLPPDIAGSISGKLRVIPNGIAEDFFEKRPEHQRRQSERMRSEPFKVLYVGTFIRRKNLPILIRAARVLRDQGKLEELRIIGGSGGRSGGIPGVAGNQPAYIRVMKRMTGRELILQYRWADVFAMPSMHETFGLVYAEALSQGTPVVCTEREGFSDWIRRDVTGAAVENPRNANEVADAIARIASRGDSTACLTDANRFRWASIAGEYADLYTSVCDHKE